MRQVFSLVRFLGSVLLVLLFCGLPLQAQGASFVQSPTTSHALHDTLVALQSTRSTSAMGQSGSLTIVPASKALAPAAPPIAPVVAKAQSALFVSVQSPVQVQGAAPVQSAAQVAVQVQGAAPVQSLVQGAAPVEIAAQRQSTPTLIASTAVAPAGASLAEAATAEIAATTSAQPQASASSPASNQTPEPAPATFATQPPVSSATPANQGAAPSMYSFSTTDWGKYFEAIGVLFLLLAGLWGILWLLRRQRYSGAKGLIPLMYIESRLPLAPKKWLIVARFENKRLVLGMTDSSISLLTELDVADPATEKDAPYGKTGKASSPISGEAALLAGNKDAFATFLQQAKAPEKQA